MCCLCVDVLENLDNVCKCEYCISYQMCINTFHYKTVYENCRPSKAMRFPTSASIDMPLVQSCWPYNVKLGGPTFKSML